MYKVGGSLPEDDPSYVVRKADSEFYQLLIAGEFCYVFNSRQMGKSSLLVRTKQRLEAEGFACAKIDFSILGSEEGNLEQWYTGIVYSLVTELKFIEPQEFFTWWDEHNTLSSVQRLGTFIEEVMLPNFQKNIIIFIDEIDSILSLKFRANDFFALIRSCYNNRSFKPEYHRLTFALLGVATPSDLIEDKKRTPFNIGSDIQLEGFKESEIEPLARGLQEKVNNPQAVMREVLAWTGGQPFLTQKVCKLLLEHSTLQVVNAGEWVERVIRTQVIENWQSLDKPPHLITIKDRICTNEEISSRLLGLYQQILQSGEITIDDSIAQIKLRLSGLVVKKQARLTVHNKIYAAVFDLNWVERELADLRPYAEAFKIWKNSNFQDESRLLRGKALRDARSWATGKSLSDEDYRYLDASQELDKREVQSALEVKEEESRILAEANETLTKAQRKARRQINIGGTILALSIVAAIIAGIFASNAIQQSWEAQEGTKLEQKGVAALRQFESQELEALLTAMDAGQRLQELVKDGRPPEKYPAASPILALQTILNNIHERNRFQKYDLSNIHDPGHTSPDVEFSHDGKYILTTSKDQTVSLWDLSGWQLFKIEGREVKIERREASWRKASFSPDGQHIVTVDYGLSRIWDLSGKLIAELKGQHSPSFSPDGQHIITTSDDKTARIWDLSGRLLVVLKGHQKYASDAIFSPDGQHIITQDENVVRLWDLSGKQLAVVEGDDANFSPDGKHILTILYSSEKFHYHTARIWDLSGKLLAELDGTRSGIQKPIFSPDGQRILTTWEKNKSAVVWDLSGRMQLELKGHKNKVRSSTFSPDGQRILTVSWDDTARLWDLSGRQLAEFRASDESVSFSPNGQRIVTIFQNIVYVWDLLGRQLAEFKGHLIDVQKAVFSPHGLYISTVSSDNTVRLWDLSLLPIVIPTTTFYNRAKLSENGQHILTYGISIAGAIPQLWNRSGKLLTEFQLNQADELYAAFFSIDGQQVFTVSFNRNRGEYYTQIWNLFGKLLVQLPGRVDDLSSDGQRIVTNSFDKGISTARVWNVSGKLLAEFKEHVLLETTRFSPDGHHLVSIPSFNAFTDKEKTASVWDLSGQRTAILKGYKGGIHSVNFSPNGQYIITASTDNTARLWNLSGKLLVELAHPSEVISGNFSPDGRLIITASYDDTTRVWDLSGKLLLEIRGFYASFSSDGKYIITKLLDNTTRIWDFSGRQVAEFPYGFTDDGKQGISNEYGTIRVWQFAELDELLTQGCDWLQD